MNFDHPKDQRLITGMSGSGKSTLWLSMMRVHRARWKCVFDADLEVHRKFGWPRAVTVQEMEFYMSRCQPFCFDPMPMFGDRREGFAFCSRWFFTVAQSLRGVKLFCVDEMSKVQRPGIGGVPVKFLEMADAGRREEIDMLLCSHSPAQVHKDVRMHMSEIFTLRHNDPDQLSALREHGFDPAEVSSLPYPGGYVQLNILNGAKSIHAPNAPRKRSSTRSAKG